MAIRPEGRSPGAGKVRPLALRVRALPGLLRGGGTLMSAEGAMDRLTLPAERLEPEAERFERTRPKGTGAGVPVAPAPRLASPPHPSDYTDER